MTCRHLTVALAALLLAATAAAQCARGPQTSEVTLPDFLAVYYAQFRSDAAADAAEFYGGVCVTAVGGEWTVIAEEVRVEGLSGALGLTAPEPTLYLGEWQITADLLEADTTGLTLINAELDGPSGSGSASGLVVDLTTGEMTLHDLTLAGSAFAVRGELAVLEGSSLRVEGAGLTTCIGMETAPYEVIGQVAQVNLDEREVRIHSGSLRVGRIALPLRDEVVVSEAAFADFELPFKVSFVRGGAETPGAGLNVRLVGLPAAPNVNAVIGGTGLDAEHVTQGVLLLEVEADVPEREGVTHAAAMVGVESSSPYLDLELTRAITPWLDLGFRARSGAEPARHARHEGSLSLRAATDVRAIGGDVAAEVFAAATAVTAAAWVAEPQVAGPRLGAAADAHAEWRATPVSTFALDARAETTYYPHTWRLNDLADEPVLQWGVRLAPSWRYANGPISLSLSYDARFTNAASPFVTNVDRLTPLQRANARVRVAGEVAAFGERDAAGVPSGGVLTGLLGASATYDPLPTATPAGLKLLTVEAGLGYANEPWRFGIETRAELSGLLATTGREPYVELEATAERTGWPVLNPDATLPAVPHGTLALGLLTNYSLEPGAETLQALELNAAVPLAFDTFELRPYLAFDFAGTVTAGTAPSWSGYGLDATFITCCGSLTVGLLNDRGNWSAGIGIDLERRPPPEDPGIMPGDR